MQPAELRSEQPTDGKEWWTPRPRHPRVGGHQWTPRLRHPGHALSHLDAKTLQGHLIKCQKPRTTTNFYQFFSNCVQSVTYSFLFSQFPYNNIGYIGFWSNILEPGKTLLRKLNCVSLPSLRILQKILRIASCFIFMKVSAVRNLR